MESNNKPVPDSAFHLKWCKTWPNTPNDFIARKGKSFCRIRLTVGGPQDGKWSWSAAPNNRNAGTGYENSAREAALAAETAYFKAGGNPFSKIPFEPSDEESTDARVRQVSAVSQIPEGSQDSQSA